MLDIRYAQSEDVQIAYSGLAGANEVLVSGTVRDLVAGSGLEFNDRGKHQLKGVPGEWQVYEAL